MAGSSSAAGSSQGARAREFDVVVYGATGFTGRLVAEYLYERHGVGGGLAWAIAGRNDEKLASIRTALGPGARSLPMIVADGGDTESLERMAARTRVVCTTVGPYARYGSALVETCARSGTHYCDLAGEVPWMRRMIDAHEKLARDSGARIVHCCGFDSMPSDLGVYRLQSEMRERHGVPCSRIKLRVRAMNGGFSGGTIASMIGIFEEASRDRSVARLLANPYSLNPEGEQSGPDRGDARGPERDPDFGGVWTAPFVMGIINTRIVRRSNALLGYAYGKNFRYDEAMLLQKGAIGWAGASAVSAGLGGVGALASFGATRRLLERFVPAPGEGPSQRERETGNFVLDLLGFHPEAEREAGRGKGADDPRNLRLRIRGDRDPGYGSTSKMLGEAAAALALDDLPVGGGFWTPASAMGEALLERLPAHAGVSFNFDG